MEKIKDLSKVLLTSDAMLGEVIKPKRYIIAPDGAREDDLYIPIIAVGDNVKDMQIGDIIIKYGGQATGFKYKDVNGVEKEVAVLHRGAVLIAVKPDNFIDPDKVTEKINI